MMRTRESTYSILTVEGLKVYDNPNSITFRIFRNGRQFLTNLMQREQRNYQFDFLRPQHSLFQYFTKLLEQYTKVLIPPKDLMKKLSDEGNSEKKILEQVRYRVAWIKHQEAKRRKEEEAKERERVSYAQIDWHGFVVVETVDYQVENDFEFLLAKKARINPGVLQDSWYYLTYQPQTLNPTPEALFLILLVAIRS